MAKSSSAKKIKTSKSDQNDAHLDITTTKQSRKAEKRGTVDMTIKDEPKNDGLIKSKKAQLKKNQQKDQRQRIVTMQALQEMSDDDDDGDGKGELPPESEWTKEAVALKIAIEAGTFDAAVLKSHSKDDNDESSFEEVDLESDDDEDKQIDDVDENEVDADDNNDEEDDDDDNDEDDDCQSEDVDNDEKNDSDNDVDEMKVDKVVVVIDQEDVEEDDNEKDDNDEEDEEDDDNDHDNDDESRHAMSEMNATRAKALQVVTTSLLAAKKDWEWSETFDIVASTPLPFNKDVVIKNGLSPNAATSISLGIHDDLQREVAFYDVALEAVLEAKTLCHKAGIPFTRPDDFFAEMVKTDDHMAKVKDRLIFENKKIEAVAQRKSNKEQKLRAKETQANKLADKAKKKRDHMQQVNDWAESARASRGGNDTSIPTNKKRAYSDQKFGHGGKRGRFKQNDPQSMNDMSSYNKKKGTFTNTPKTNQGRKSGAGANRQGKRARDASRSKSR